MPNVFVSSTCYDLSQIRRDLEDFLLELNYKPFLSEQKTFPINSDSDTFTNCIENVRNQADIFILIIGNRYGSSVNDGKSITNLEYLAAKEKGIPRYIFILKSLIPALAIWEKNKDGNFQDIVNDTRVFDFISEVRNESKDWCFEYEYSQDIVSGLKSQFAYLLKSLLDRRKQEKKYYDKYFMNTISPKARRIIIEEQPLFEHFFFQQVLVDERLKYTNLKKYYDYEIIFSSSEHISDPLKLTDWIQKNLRSMTNLSKSFSKIINTQLNHFFSMSEGLEKLEGLNIAAIAIMQILREMIECSQKIKSTSVDEDFVPLKNLFSRYLDKSIKALWIFPEQAKRDFDSALETVLRGENAYINHTITLEMDESCERDFNRQLKVLEKKYGLKYSFTI